MHTKSSLNYILLEYIYNSSSTMHIPRLLVVYVQASTCCLLGLGSFAKQVDLRARTHYTTYSLVVCIICIPLKSMHTNHSTNSK